MAATFAYRVLGLPRFTDPLTDALSLVTANQVVLMDLKSAFQQVCDRCGNHDEKESLSMNDPIAKAIVANLEVIAQWLREEFKSFNGTPITVEVSKGVGNFPRVPWVCLLPPGQQVKDGIYAGICFAKDGKGAVVGCLQSVGAPKGLKTVTRTGSAQPPAIDVDGHKPNTRYNNAFANPIEIFRDSFDEAAFRKHIATSLAIAMTHNAGGQPTVIIPQLPDEELNVILFGPPGTGKTYDTVRRAVLICDHKVPATREDTFVRYQELRKERRIDFVTFHQSYGYEDFVEGIRPVTESASAGMISSAAADHRSQSSNVRYECQAGILKDLCTLARSKGTQHASESNVDFANATIWKMSLGDTQDPDDAAIYDECISENRILLGYGKGLDFSGCKNREDILETLKSIDPTITKNDYNLQAIDAFRLQMKPGDIVVISDGNHKFRAIAKITGEYTFLDRSSYQQMRPVEWLTDIQGSLPRDMILSKYFSQMTLYKLKTKDLNLSAMRELITREEAGPRNHVLIIDEINRGNISKILGELITLLERDKRIGRPNELRVTLPYSRDEFGMPDNVYVSGTMNTADRSIAFLDVALRRRFKFIELMPDAAVIRQAVGQSGILDGIDVAQLLVAINDRIELLYDRDHQIGHAFFLKVKSLPDLRDVFCDRVIPLLQEYFYGDWGKVCLVLGCPFDESGSSTNKNPAPMIKSRLLPADLLLGGPTEFVENKVQCRVNQEFINASTAELLLPFFRGIFGTTKAD